jgi:hypothetical protein
MIATLRDVIAAFDEGRTHQQRFVKSASAAGDLRWTDWSYASGQPAYDARVGDAGAFTPLVAAGNDAIYFPPIPAGQQRLLVDIELCPLANGNNQVSLNFVVYDLLGYYPLIDGDSTDLQLFDNTLTLPRYTDGRGLQAVLVNHIAPTLSNGGGTLVYVDDAGAEQSVTFSTAVVANGQVMSAASLGGDGSALSLPTKGIQRAVSLQYSTAPGGLACLYIIRPLTSVVAVRDAYEAALSTKVLINSHLPIANGFHMPQVLDGAHLGFFFCVNGGSRTTAVTLGTMTFAWG